MEKDGRTWMLLVALLGDNRLETCGIAVLDRLFPSHALLPMAGVAAAMKAGDDQEGIGFNEEKERVGKYLRARSTETLKDGGELPRIASYASNDAVDFGAEATA
jgi:hypothetical protein